MINIKDYLYFKNLYELTGDPKVFRDLNEGIHELIEKTPFFFDIFRDNNLIYEYLEEVLDVLNFRGKKTWPKCDNECGKCHIYTDKAIDIMHIPYYKGYVIDEKLLEELLNNFKDNMLLENCPNLTIYYLNEVPSPFVKILSDYMLMNSLVEIVAIWVGQVVEWLGTPLDYMMIDKSLDSSISIIENVKKDNDIEIEKFVIDVDTPVDYSKYRVLPILTDEFYQSYKDHMLELMFEWLLGYKSREYIMRFISDNFENFLRSLKQMINYYVECKTDIDQLLNDVMEKLRGGY